MPRPRSSDTRARIQATALELFAAKGVQQTSLREIAERLGVTKPALYYHFSSREDLVRSLVQPLIDEVEALLAADEARGGVDPRELLARYFDATYRHRRITTMIVSELVTLSYLDLGARIADWRWRLIALLTGPDAPLEAQARAIVAVGGMGDCMVFFGDRPVEELRPAALNAAYAALGLPPAGD